MLPPKIIKPCDTIVAGGALGAERAALDFAFACQINHFGFCARGRPCEEGQRIPLHYALIETITDDDAEAVSLNVSVADATVFFLPGLTESSSRTALMLSKCTDLKQPFLLLKSNFDAEADASRLAHFLGMLPIASLHVTGHRESEASGVYRHVVEVLKRISS